MKYFLNALTFFVISLPLVGFTQSVEKRIDECEQSGDQTCIFALLRELAQKNASQPSEYVEPETCTITVPKPGMFTFSNSRGSYSYVTFFDLEIVKALSRDWKKLNCGYEGKVKCSIQDSGYEVPIPKIEVGNQFSVILSLRSRPEDILAELKHSICLKFDDDAEKDLQKL